MTALLPLKLARPHEIPLLEQAGYEIAAPPGDSFTLMRLARETDSDVEQYNAAQIRDNREREKWRDTFVDADAARLAAEVREIVAEMEGQ